MSEKREPNKKLWIIILCLILVAAIGSLLAYKYIGSGPEEAGSMNQVEQNAKSQRTTEPVEGETGTTNRTGCVPGKPCEDLGSKEDVAKKAKNELETCFKRSTSTDASEQFKVYTQCWWSHAETATEMVYLADNDIIVSDLDTDDENLRLNWHAKIATKDHPEPFAEITFDYKAGDGFDVTSYKFLDGSYSPKDPGPRMDAFATALT